MAPMQESGWNKAFFSSLFFNFLSRKTLHKAFLLFDIKYIVKENISDKTGDWNSH